MMRAPFPTPRAARGFTLLELLLVIVIVGVLLGALLGPLATRIEVQQVRDQQRTMEDVRDVLLGYAQAAGRLPCADTDGDGLENDTPSCQSVGELPYATLGVTPTDRWGRRYRYAVAPAATVAALTGQPAPNAGLDLSDAGNVTLSERLEDKSLSTITTTGAAVVVSLGSNGFGGTDLNGNVLAAPTGADELENVDGDTTFVTRIRTPGGPGCDDTSGAAPLCEFDDMVTLVPMTLLLGRLVQAGRLP